MGHRVIAAVSISTALLLAAGAASLAQGQLPRPGQLPPAGGQQRGPAPPPQQQQQRPQQQQQQQQQSTAPKPYKAVAIKPAGAMNDPSFAAFRKQLGEIADKKNRPALAGLVSKNFFWMGEKGDQADKKRPGIDNLAKAIGLDGKDADGWDALANYAAEETAAPSPDNKDTICAPAQPDFNDEEFSALIKSTNTEDGDWGYPSNAGIEMHATAQANSPVIEKLGANFIRVLEDAPDDSKDPMLKVVAPSGKTGFVAADAISPLGNEEMCYVKEGGAWKIAGVNEGG